MFLKKFVKKIQVYQNKKGQDKDGESLQSQIESDSQDYQLTENLEENLKALVAHLGSASDIKKHGFKAMDVDAGLLYVDGMVNNQLITDSIMLPLINNKTEASSTVRGKEFADSIKNKVLFNNDCTVTENFGELITAILAGDSVLLFEGCKYGITVSTKGYETRAITEPQTELVVRGPREGFNENLRTSTSLIRRIIRSPKLRMENVVIGEKSRTNVCIMYIDGVANPSLVKKVKNRLRAIKVDSILDSGYIEEYIEDSPLSIFPTVGYTEKPDVCSAKILEGRVAILVDGSPFALTVPFLFIESFQTAEDYYVRPLYATVLRLMRLFSYFISIFLLPIFIALTTYHQELIPTTLLFTIANAREGTPFPAIVEALILVMSFEILREAGLRLPRPVGQAISIVGALIMGDAAVAAGLVGAPMVIAVALSAVAGFVTPDQIDCISIMRFMLMIAAATMGGYGISLGFLVLLIHLASLRSFGVPYFNTFIFSRDLLDGFVRFPLWTMNKRPKDIAYGDATRIQTFLPPAVKRQTKKDDEQSDK